MKPKTKKEKGKFKQVVHDTAHSLDVSIKIYHIFLERCKTHGINPTNFSFQLEIECEGFSGLNTEKYLLNGTGLKDEGKD